MPTHGFLDTIKYAPVSLDGLCKNIILTGLTGCGKSSIGKVLAQRIGWGFIDLDDWIEKIFKSSPEKIINKKGMPYFRNCEYEALSSLHRIQNHVISLGGGTICEKKTRTFVMRMGLVVWLDVSPHVITRRLLKNTHELKKRPLLTSKQEKTSLPDPQELLEKLESLLINRHSYYKNSHLVVSDDYSSITICAQKVYRLVTGRKL